MFAIEVNAAVRRFIFLKGHSRREAARVFGLSWETVQKMCRFSLPPGYTRTAPVLRPKLGGLLRVIDAILEAEQSAPVKQRHTAKRIFERLRDEYGFAGGYTVVKDYVRIGRTRYRETFVPLSHSPGHAQVDFGEAIDVIGSVWQKLHFLLRAPAPVRRVLRQGVFVRDDRSVSGRPRSGLRVLRRGGAIDPVRQPQDRGDEDLRRWQAPTDAGVHRAGQPLSVCRPLRQALQVQRQRQSRGLGQMCPGQHNDIGPGDGELRRAPRHASRLLPCPAVRLCRPAYRDHCGRLAADRAVLRELPTVPLEPCEKRAGRVSSTSLVRYRNNDYSVPTAYGYRDVVVKGLSTRAESDQPGSYPAAVK